MSYSLTTPLSAYNAEGMKRRGFSTEEITEVKLIYKTLYRSNLSFADARDSIDKMAETSRIANNTWHHTLKG